MLEPLGGRASRDTFIHSITLPVSDEKYRQLMGELAQSGISHNEYRNWVFEDGELDEAEFFDMSPAGYWGYPQPEDNYLNESYDMSTACPACGRGYVQTKPYLIKGRPRFGRNDILAINWTYEFLVAERLRKLLLDAGLDGADFWELTDIKTKTPVPGYYQLLVRNELPPMSPSTRFRKVRLSGDVEPCQCGRLGKALERESEFGPVALIKYRRSSLKAAKDFNKTKEWLSEGFDSTQRKIVSAGVRKLFLANEIKSVRFEPVIIEN